LRIIFHCESPERHKRISRIIELNVVGSKSNFKLKNESRQKEKNHHKEICYFMLCSRNDFEEHANAVVYPFDEIKKLQNDKAD